MKHSKMIMLPLLGVFCLVFQQQTMAQVKISNQMDIEMKRKLASLCIDNSSTLKNLQNEIEKIITQIL